ncbi:MAG: hypothetical protein M1834_009456 [Cirrosporium novae-zelandiae]|nr:MAG: hypothetical protein M1834_009456 [Cirrosporium novae-zelandiae]
MSLTSATMKAVLWTGTPFNVTVSTLPIPTIQSSTDAIVRVTAAGICGTDLHTYRGHYGSTTPPWSMGHEAIGYISDIGDAVHALQLGDHVVISDMNDSGAFSLEPLTAYPFGMGPDRGDLGGCQAEYVRVPYADENLMPLPASSNATSNSTNNATNASEETDYLFVSDIFATGWTALDFAGFESGDTVAIFGAGPVGLLSAYSATLRGASRVYIVDYVTKRLDLAASFGAIPINFRDSDPAEQILTLEPDGVTRSVDCVGFEAFNSQLKPDEHVVIRNMVNVTARGGGMGVAGIYSNTQNSTGTPLGGEISPDIAFPIGSFFRKGLSFRGGGVDPRLVAPQLMELIATGKANVSFIISSQVGIEEAPEAYARFNRHEETKVVIRFP